MNLGVKFSIPTVSNAVYSLVWTLYFISATSGSSESHEPTSFRNQKRNWRESLDDSVSVLDIGMSELVAPDDFMSIEQSSLLDSETARTPLSDIRCKSDSLNAESTVD